jgi:UDP-glucuronate 4-epimerase
MRAIVTGAAGFIGSHLSELLCRTGWEVVGVDSLTDYYSPDRKRDNLHAVKAGAGGRFAFHELDLLHADLRPLLEDVDVVFHQAGQPGVRLSWNTGFDTYVARNVLLTQRLLQASLKVGLQRFVYASSSSIYGNRASYPSREGDNPTPFSPYGVTKLAAEHLCSLYASNWELQTVSLRYFTVYGPRQRPDMAMSKFIDAALAGEPIPVFGDGGQIRDFTFVGDVVAANVAAASADVQPGTYLNVAGGGSITVSAMLDVLAAVVGRQLEVEHMQPQPGDVRQTGGSIDLAGRLLGWSPSTDLRTGLTEQVKWHLERQP